MSEGNPTFTDGPEILMRENAKRLDAQAELLTVMALEVVRAADNQLTRRFVSEFDAARTAVQAAAAALRNAARSVERFGERIEKG